MPAEEPVVAENTPRLADAAKVALAGYSQAFRGTRDLCIQTLLKLEMSSQPRAIEEQIAKINALIQQTKQILLFAASFGGPTERGLAFVEHLLLYLTYNPDVIATMKLAIDSDSEINQKKLLLLLSCSPAWLCQYFNRKAKRYHPRLLRGIFDLIGADFFERIFKHLEVLAEAKQDNNKLTEMFDSSTELTKIMTDLQQRLRQRLALRESNCGADDRN